MYVVMVQLVPKVTRSSELRPFCPALLEQRWRGRNVLVHALYRRGGKSISITSSLFGHILNQWPYCCYVSMCLTKHVWALTVCDTSAVCDTTRSANTSHRNLLQHLLFASALFSVFVDVYACELTQHCLSSWDSICLAAAVMWADAQHPWAVLWQRHFHERKMAQEFDASSNTSASPVLLCLN